MKKILSLILLSGFAAYSAQAQIQNENLWGQRNVITTAAPFLMISPDSRAAGMGDLGVATSPDINSIHWNASKLAFADRQGGISLSAAPWLRSLVPDVWHYYLAGYGKVGKRSALAASLRYFTLGEIQFTDIQGGPLGVYNPNEFAVDGAYSTQLSDNFALGVALRFIYSDLARGQVGITGAEIKAGVAGAGDISAYYKNKTTISGTEFDYSIGMAFTNMGNKISYTNDAERDFIPTNWRIGTFWNTVLDEHNEFGFGFDFNKLLVPTPQYIYDTLDPTMVVGKQLSTANPISGMITSFTDAPGGFNEEIREFTVSIGTEYWYDRQFALRAGYFHEAETKGAREYITFGVGLKYQVFQIDAAYLQPFTQRHPLQNTLRFSLLFDMDAFRNMNDEENFDLN